MSDTNNTGAKTLEKTTNSYIIQDSAQEIEINLKEFKELISTEPDNFQYELPSVSLLGIGRCGTNIATRVGYLLYRAKRAIDPKVLEEEKGQFDLDDDVIKQSNPPTNPIFITNLRKRFNSIVASVKKLVRKQNGSSAMFLINPIILVADLDKDVTSRIERREKWIKQGYKRFRLMDLNWVQGGGSGNVPILGQYMAKLALNIINARPDVPKDWILDRTYLIDSSGSRSNNTRLFFYVFSAGGGSGSGMSNEFGLSQQFSYHKKMGASSNKDNISTEQSDSEKHKNLFEPIFSVGISILPNIEDSIASNAVYVNSGRSICRYLSRAYRFEQNYNYDSLNPDMLSPFNCLILISNDIMKWATETGNADDKKKGSSINISVSEAEKISNQYVSHQIFNLLTAQALATDYSEKDIRALDDVYTSAGIDIGETIRLDANDLNNSLNGPVAVAFAEEKVSDITTKAADISINNLIKRAIQVPEFDSSTSLIEGISILPISKQKYEEKISKKGKLDFNAISEVPLFKRANSVVTIISVPADYPLAFNILKELKDRIVSMFPNANIRRYSLVQGTSENISLTILISGSACSSTEVLSHLATYIRSCFYEPSENGDKFNEIFKNAIMSKDFSDTKLKKILRVKEDQQAILAGYSGPGVWNQIKGPYETKFSQIVGKTLSMDDILLNQKDVIDAIHYVHESMNHEGLKREEVDVDDWLS